MIANSSRINDRIPVACEGKKPVNGNMNPVTEVATALTR